MSLFKHLFSKTLSAELTITSSNGFHLRPVAQFASLSKSFPCSITATFQGKTVETKSVNTLLSLSLEKGDTFTLQVQGKQADTALKALTEHFETLMGTDSEVQTIQKGTADYEGTLIEGEIVFQGIAIAPVYTHIRKEVQHSTTMSFQEAVQASLDELDVQHQLHQEEEQGSIYLAQKALLDALGETCNTLLELEESIEKEIKTLGGGKLASKEADYRDILQTVQKHLGLEIQVSFPERPFILLANDLLPSEIDALSKTQVQGVILQNASIHSHTAILLRSFGIVSLIADIGKIAQNTLLILDSHAGSVVRDPSEEDLKKAQQHAEKDKKQQTQSAVKRFEEAYTAEGAKIKVLANVSDPASAKIAKEEGAEGIGLLRSEFLFKENKPSLETQEKAYAEIFSCFDDVTVRTLDVGGDKALPYIEIPKENNPFLGIRGVRLFQSHPALLEEQLLAIFKAANGQSIKIMFPMVSTVEEFTEAKTFAQNIAKKHQQAIDTIAFGIMIEVPSVLFLLEAFNEVVDFYSIGSNDLSQYLFAIERTHPTLSVDTHSPVLFSAIEMIVQKVTKPLSICGELAADPLAIEKLLHSGIQTLSVSPKSIAQTKETIRHV